MVKAADIISAALTRATADLVATLAESSAIPSSAHLVEGTVAREMQRYEHAFRQWLRITELRQLIAGETAASIASDVLLSAKMAQNAIWQLSISQAVILAGRTAHNNSIRWWIDFADLINTQRENHLEFVEHLMRRDQLEDCRRIYELTSDPFFETRAWAKEIWSADIRFLRAIRSQREYLQGFTGEVSKRIIRIPSRWWWYAEEVANGHFVGLLPDELSRQTPPEPT